VITDRNEVVAQVGDKISFSRYVNGRQKLSRTVFATVVSIGDKTLTAKSPGELFRVRPHFFSVLERADGTRPAMED